MSKILDPIPPQGFELVRDRIALILADEIANQYLLTANEDINATVFLERTVPVDHTECPVVNVSLRTANFADHVAINTDDTVFFNIDVYHKSKTEGDSKGDSLSNLKLQRLLGLCRAILENPVYKRLDFNGVAFIQNRHFESMEIAEPGKQDALSTSMGRLVFSVRIPEVTQLVLTTIAGGFDTSMKMELTDKGYTFTVDE